MECNFTLKHYEEIINAAKEKGYDIFRMCDSRGFVTSKKFIVLRHDIDFNFRNVLRVAHHENKLGVKSTFFVRVHAPYNPLGYDNLDVMAKLIGMGHEIGLHLEKNAFREIPDVSAVRLYKKILEENLGITIQGIAAHDQGRGSARHETFSNKELDEAGINYDAQSDIYFRDMKYISDSSGRWREGCACNFINAGVPKLCILTHPEWWFEKTPAENY